MTDNRHILIRMLWATFAILGTPLFAIWGGIDEASPYLKLAWRDFKDGFIGWFKFLKKMINDINRDI